MPEIVPWSTIADQFNGSALLLGNGASMATHAGFGYASLHEAAHENGNLTPDVNGVFDAFGTDDFELVLRRLWQAKLVNQALGIEPGKVELAYEQVRTALIETVRAIHISHDAAAPHFDAIYKFMQRFETVISLNYDLIVYWARMRGNAELGNWFKDGFQGSTFRDDWDKLREPYQAAGSCMVFYPHGNLVLNRHSDGSEQKQIAQAWGAGLLEEILDEWETGEVSPLFVSEGTAEHKQLSIESSSYLHRVFREVIPKIGDRLVVYGWGCAEQDRHIINQLSRAGLQRVAVSVRGNNQKYAQRVEDEFLGIGAERVLFFDANSQGCWIQPWEVGEK